MRILCAMLGGTISSFNASGTVKLGEPSFVRDCLDSKMPQHEFLFPSFNRYSSEDATPEDYREALRGIAGEAQRTSPDGILITHGTDTCAFFAQLAYRVLGSLKIPFVITGSVKAPDVDPEEASGNLDASVKCLEQGKSGVVFRNIHGQPVCYRAYLIMSPDIRGCYAEYEDGIEPEIRGSEDFFAKKDLPKILVIPAFPGAVIPETGFDRVLICCNHSGTASTDLEESVRKWTAAGIRCYMAPIPVEGGVYESRKRLRDAGAYELPGMPVEGAWSEVLLR